MKVQRPVILAILDGWGIGPLNEHNAIYQAKTPTIDYLWEQYPHTQIGAAGEHIGLHKGHQGSTEMGHLIIGAGRNMMLPQIQMQLALENHEFETNESYLKAIKTAKEQGTRLHLMGLLSDAGVHSYDAVCYALLAAAAKEGLKREQVFVHIFSDGRDTPPESLGEHVARLQAKIQEIGVGVIASVQGRFWAMDRDHRWDRVEKAYNMLVHGRADRTVATIEEAIELARQNKETDEFISPTLIDPAGTFHAGDSVINYNYRVDREIEITQALIEPNFTEFDRGNQVDITYIATYPYYTGMPAPAAFERTELEMRNILAEVLSAKGLKQYRVTETEKWPYVTKIFNGMREDVFEGEYRHLIPSDKVKTYDLKPEMQAVPIAEEVAKQLSANEFDCYILNICNADIVGHTGNKEAIIKGCEAADRAIEIIFTEAKKHNAILVIVADHGNAEQVWDMDNTVPHTQHTANLVPCIIVDEERKGIDLRSGGALKDVAPTVLELLGIEKPAEMTGESLIQ